MTEIPSNLAIAPDWRRGGYRIHTEVRRAIKMIAADRGETMEVVINRMLIDGIAVERAIKKGSSK